MAKTGTAYLLFALICCFLSKISVAQLQVLPRNQPEQDACNALTICGNTFFTPYSYQGQGRKEDLASTPCGSGEGNSVWLCVKIATPGKVVFTLTPVDAEDDYDFAVLNIRSTTCGNLSADDVVRCNFNSNRPGSNRGGIVGLNGQSSFSSVKDGDFGKSFCSAINAFAGETYLVMINNFGHDDSPGPSKGFTIDFGGSTATFVQADAPALSNTNIRVCYNATSVTVPLTQPVLCSSISPDGTDFTSDAPFAITGATGVNCAGTQGYTNAVTLQFAGTSKPGTYTINAKQGQDGNTLLGLCGSPLLLPSSATFTIPKAPAPVIDSEFICYNQLPYLWNGLSIAEGGKTAAVFNAQSVMGCDSVIILNLTVSPAPATTNLAKTLCAGQVYRLSWNDSAVNTAGVYTHVYAHVTGCDSAITTVITSIDSASKNTKSFICSDSIKLLSIGTGYKNIVWQTGATTPGITISRPGTYTVQAIDSLGCMANDTFDIAIDVIRSALAKNITLCKGTVLPLDAGAGYTSYIWGDGSTQQILNINNGGNYWVTVTDIYGCQVTDTARVLTVPVPADFLNGNVTKCFYKTVTLQPGHYYSTYLWSTGAVTPAINVLTPGTYTLEVTDANACTGADSIKVIDSACKQYLYIPTAFTPNGDGHNDVFKAVFGGIAIQYSFIVYNRWGQKIFESGDPGTGWDGTANGHTQPGGVYTWFCRYQLVQQQPVLQKGTVVLIR